MARCEHSEQRCSSTSNHHKSVVLVDGLKGWADCTKALHVARPSTLVPRSDKFQHAIRSELVHLFCGERSRASAAELLGVTSTHVRQKGTSGPSICVQNGTSQAVLRSNVAIAAEGDMWQIATRGMHMAEQELSELLVFLTWHTMTTQHAGLASNPLHLAVQDKQP